jgi:4-amino-4-deoxy-L-arabinose transferase-like glycosyltransferase
MRQMAPADERRAWRIVLACTAALTLARLAVLALTPLELYPDEAQYWLWSRRLAFGYFSKPPMVAWLIHLTTALGGDAEAYVRASSPLLHAGAGLIVFAIGRRLYDARSGLAGFAVYQLAPGVLASAFVVSTDAALLFFLTLALWFYVDLQSADGRRRILSAAGFGLALGLAFLSKYAALYALIGVALHLALDRSARRRWSPASGAAAAAALGAVMAPNVIWNATHGFATLAHTAGNAHWDASQLFDVASLGEFLIGQFGVFGPVPFAVLVGGGVVLAFRRKLMAPDVLLLAFALPPIITIAAQAFISRANANWAAAAYGAGAVLVGAWLVRWKAWRWLWIGVGQQGVVGALALVMAVNPSIADAVGASNSLKRLRGWRQLTGLIVERARTEEGAGALSAVAVDDRFTFNAAAYYGRDYFGREGPPLRIWVRGRTPENQAELEAALIPRDGARVLAVSIDGRNSPAMAADFAAVTGRQIVSVRLDAKHARRAEMMLGEGFAPKPRP